MMMIMMQSSAAAITLLIGGGALLLLVPCCFAAATFETSASTSIALVPGYPRMDYRGPAGDDGATWNYYNDSDSILFLYKLDSGDDGYYNNFETGMFLNDCQTSATPLDEQALQLHDAPTVDTKDDELRLRLVIDPTFIESSSYFFTTTTSTDDIFHNKEQEHQPMVRVVAHSISFCIRLDWYMNDPAHVPTPDMHETVVTISTFTMTQKAAAVTALAGSSPPLYLKPKSTTLTSTVIMRERNPDGAASSSSSVEEKKEPPMTTANVAPQQPEGKPDVEIAVDTNDDPSGDDTTAPEQYKPAENYYGDDYYSSAAATTVRSRSPIGMSFLLAILLLLFLTTCFRFDKFRRRRQGYNNTNNKRPERPPAKRQIYAPVTSSSAQEEAHKHYDHDLTLNVSNDDSNNDCHNGNC
jgi:hypothetical protein